VQRYTYGNAARSGLRLEERELLGLDVDGDRVRGKRGTLRLTPALIRAHDLRPGWTIERGNDAAFVLGLRAYLARHPDAPWTPARLAARLLGVKGARVIVDSRSFAHVLGRGRGKWHGLPSRSTTYRSLALALVSGDARHFRPGQSNLDWRRHLRVRSPLAGYSAK
jgi:hypothetical protein